MKKKSLRMIVGADLHGHLPPLPSTDLLLLAGDIFPWQEHALGYQRKWQDEVFLPWLHHQPATTKILVAGNHDFLWQKEPPLGDFVYLQDSSTEVGGWKIWGTPWTPPKEHTSKQWAFKETEKDLRKRFQKIDPKTDILVSHGPPWGLLDWTGRRHVGSSAMLKALQKTHPALFICGHIHESGGSLVQNGTVLLNSTIRDRDRRAGSMWSVDLGPDGLFWERSTKGAD